LLQAGVAGTDAFEQCLGAVAEAQAHWICHANVCSRVGVKGIFAPEGTGRET